jgi:hypothetical protein
MGRSLPRKRELEAAIGDGIIAMAKFVGAYER